MSLVAVVIPYDVAGDPSRERALGYVVGHYEAQGLPVVVAEPAVPGVPWSKGTVVDRGVRRTTAPVLVIADADCIVTPDALRGCLDAVRIIDTAWSQPHGTVVRLSRQATAATYEGRQLRPRPSRVHGPPGGGIVVVSREAYETVGGIDPRFVGWGGEDISFARALNTLVGPCARFDEPLVHLWHQTARPHLGRASAESELLAGRYYDANGDRAAMRALVNEYRVVCPTPPHPV